MRIEQHKLCKAIIRNNCLADSFVIVNTTDDTAAIIFPESEADTIESMVQRAEEIAAADLARRSLPLPPGFRLRIAKVDDDGLNEYGSRDERSQSIAAAIDASTSR